MRPDFTLSEELRDFEDFEETERVLYPPTGLK